MHLVLGPVVIEVALLLCTQRVGERYPVGPLLIYEIRYNEKYTSYLDLI